MKTIEFENSLVVIKNIKCVSLIDTDSSQYPHSIAITFNRDAEPFVCSFENKDDALFKYNELRLLIQTLEE